MLFFSGLLPFIWYTVSVLCILLANYGDHTLLASNLEFFYADSTHYLFNVAYLSITMAKPYHNGFFAYALCIIFHQNTSIRIYVGRVDLYFSLWPSLCVFCFIHGCCWALRWANNKMYCRSQPINLQEVQQLFDYEIVWISSNARNDH